MILREYQQRAVDDIRAAYTQGKRAPLLVLGTGGGKTCIFSYIAKGAAEKGNRVIILSHRQELVRQICKTLDAFGVPHGVIAAKRSPAPYHLTQVASVQSLVRRLETTPEPALVIADEGHHAMAKTFATVLGRWPAAKILGVTASPIRLDGRGLGGAFDCLIEGPTVQWMIDGGYLARPVYYAPPIGVDTSKLHITAGDYNKHEAEELMDKPKITGDCVAHYTRICGGKSALVFCTSLKHCEHVTAQFNAVGYRAAMIDGDLDDKTRAQRVSDLAAGRIHVLVSCELLNEGFDAGIVSAAILLRPTESLALFLQQIGRALRPAAGKDCAYIIDHVGGIFRHGFAEDNRQWSLDSAAKRPRAAAVSGMPFKQCERCYAIFTMQVACPQCGHIVEVKSREIDQVEGTLQEVKRDEVAAKRAQWEVASANGRDELRVLARQRGYSPAWVEAVLRARAAKELKARAETAKQGVLL